MARHEVYITGITPLEALARLISLDASPTHDWPAVQRIASYLNHSVKAINDTYELMADNLSRMGDTWRFVETKKGYLGMSMVTPVPGGMLCVLDHGDVPVVLRPSSDMSSFTLIGTALVVGLNNGEAVEYIRNGTSKPPWFELR